MFVLVTTPIRSFHFDLHNIELVLLFSDAMKIATFLSLGWSDSWMHAASLSSLWKPSLPLVYIHGRNFWDQCRFAVTEWSEWVMAEIPRVQCVFLCMTCAWHVFGLHRLGTVFRRGQAKWQQLHLEKGVTRWALWPSELSKIARWISDDFPVNASWTHENAYY